MATFRKKRYRSKNTRINARTYRIKRRGKKSLVRRVYKFTGGSEPEPKILGDRDISPAQSKTLDEKIKYLETRSDVVRSFIERHFAWFKANINNVIIETQKDSPMAIITVKGLVIKKAKYYRELFYSCYKFNSDSFVNDTVWPKEKEIVTTFNSELNTRSEILESGSVSMLTDNNIAILEKFKTKLLLLFDDLHDSAVKDIAPKPKPKPEPEPETGTSIKAESNMRKTEKAAEAALLEAQADGEAGWVSGETATTNKLHTLDPQNTLSERPFSGEVGQVSGDFGGDHDWRSEYNGGSQSLTRKNKNSIGTARKTRTNR